MWANVFMGMAVIAFYASSLYLNVGQTLLGLFCFSLGVVCLVVSAAITYCEKNGFVVDSADIREGLAALINDVTTGSLKWVMQVRLTFRPLLRLSTATSKRLLSMSVLRLSASRR